MENTYFVLAQGSAAPQAKQTAPAAAGNAVQQQPGKGPAQQPGLMDGLGGMLPFIIIIVAMFYLMHRGQAKERKRREEMLNSIKAGDKILTAGGIYGKVDTVNADTYKIAIADNVRIEVSKSAIAQVIRDEAAAGEKTAK